MSYANQNISMVSQKLDAVMQLVNLFLATSFEQGWDTLATTQLVNQEPWEPIHYEMTKSSVQMDSNNKSGVQVQMILWFSGLAFAYIIKS